MPLSRRIEEVVAVVLIVISVVDRTSAGCNPTQVPNSDQSVSFSISSNYTRVVCDIGYCTQASSCTERVGYALCDTNTNEFSVPSCIESTNFEFLAEIYVDILDHDNFRFDLDNFGVAMATNLCDQLSSLDIRRCRYVLWRNMNSNNGSIIVNIDLVFERDMTNLESFMEKETLKIFLAQDSTFFFNATRSVNTFDILSIQVYDESNDGGSNNVDNNNDDSSDLIVFLLGFGLGGLVLFAGLFGVVYYVGHHFGKHKHGAVVSPKNTKKVEEEMTTSTNDDSSSSLNKNSSTEEGATPVTDLKTGEQYRVRAISKHMDLEDYMQRSTPRKTKLNIGDKGGVNKAWM
jgi:hypothetical protein